MNPPPRMMAENKANREDLHLLSIEGRGTCGLTTLLTLKEVLRQCQYYRKWPQPPLPCDVFDLAGGAGSGGIIAVMLFRLGMTIDDAITSYTRLSKDGFYKKSSWSNTKTNASLLENAIAEAIHSSLNVEEIEARNMAMLDDKAPKCFISAFGNNLSPPTLFRSYAPSRHASNNCTIMEAIRATTTEDFFPSFDVGDVDVKETLIHEGSQIRNPVKAVLEEAASVFPGQSISCVLSIGSGTHDVVNFTTPSICSKGLKNLMKNGELFSDEVAKELSDRDVLYCRLRVDDGLEDTTAFEDSGRLEGIRTHTQKFLEDYDVTQKLSQLVQVLNRRSDCDTIEDTLMGLSQFLDGLITSSPGESWSMVISEFIPIVQPSKTATETLGMQCALLRDTLESCMQGRDLATLPEELKGNIRHLLEGMKNMFKHPSLQEDPMTHFNMNIRKLLEQFWVQNHMAGNIVLRDILKYIQKDDPRKQTFTRLKQHAINPKLGNLNMSPFAAFDSSEVSEKVSCFEGTCIRPLSEIARWIASDNSSLPPIYVLDGVAGTGKSTIAKTVAERAAGINALGASFFFSRNDKRITAKTFFPTIAYQLACYDQDFAEQITEALLRTSHDVTQMPIEQFSTFILEPLKEIFAMPGNPFLIVIDALDDCERDGNMLLRIFADSINDMPRLKLLITTRPEPHIRNALDRYHHVNRFHLHDIEASMLQSDIWLYLDFHLSNTQVRDKLPDLKYTWNPDKKDVEVLTQTCGNIFINASTAVKFILDRKRSDPARQLSLLLQVDFRQKFLSMDYFYTQILLAAFPGDHPEWFEHYHIVLGSIVALQYPLPCAALSALINLDSDDVISVLSHLHSLVAPTGRDMTFRIHHKSFQDFLLDPTRCGPKFHINLTAHRLELGKRCLRIMLVHS